MVDNRVSLACKVSPEEKEKLIKYCEENDITLSHLIRKSIKFYLNNKESEE